MTCLVNCEPGAILEVPAEDHPWGQICEARALLLRALDLMQTPDRTPNDRGLLIDALQKLLELHR